MTKTIMTNTMNSFIKSLFVTFASFILPNHKFSSTENVAKSSKHFAFFANSMFQIPNLKVIFSCVNLKRSYVKNVGQTSSTNYILIMLLRVQEEKLKIICLLKICQIPSLKKRKRRRVKGRGNKERMRKMWIES